MNLCGLQVFDSLLLDPCHRHFQPSQFLFGFTAGSLWSPLEPILSFWWPCRNGINRRHFGSILLGSSDKWSNTARHTDWTSSNTGPSSHLWRYKRSCHTKSLLWKTDSKIAQFSIWLFLFCFTFRPKCSRSSWLDKRCTRRSKIWCCWFPYKVRKTPYIGGCIQTSILRKSFDIPTR